MLSMDLDPQFDVDFVVRKKPCHWCIESVAPCNRFASPPAGIFLHQRDSTPQHYVKPSPQLNPARSPLVGELGRVYPLKMEMSRLQRGRP